MKRRKEEIILGKKLENSFKYYIDALVLFEQYNSKKCWWNKVIALENYLGLKRKPARLAAVKVCFLGDLNCLFILIFINIMNFIYSGTNTHEIFRVGN